MIKNKIWFRFVDDNAITFALCSDSPVYLVICSTMGEEISCKRCNKADILYTGGIQRLQAVQY